MKKAILLLAALCLSPLFSAEPSKQQALDTLRTRYAAAPFRTHSKNGTESVARCRELLQPDGRFSDLLELEKAILAHKMPASKYNSTNDRVNAMQVPAFNRIWQLAEPFRKGMKDDALKEKIYRAIQHYGQIEISRANTPARFHGSCFAIPTAAINTYFCFFDDMRRAEQGNAPSPLAASVNRTLRDVGYQAWTVPMRNDETDQNPVSVARFRKHVWWVGGNGLTYRPSLPAAIMMNSIPMIDVMAEVGNGALSQVSQNTYDEAFWTEGMTADGAGWGHGKQCIIWGYPLQGTESALSIVNQLRGTPWASTLQRPQLDALLQYIRGGAFYYFKGHTPPCLYRNNMSPIGKRSNFPALGIASNLLTNWSASLTEAERRELQQVVEAGKTGRDAFPANAPKGAYTGSRWFFNNDDMIHKNPQFMLFVNMASFRVDGMESASGGAAGYNFFVADGATMFFRSGDEYHRSMGAIELTAWPGVTTRQTPVPFKPITHWAGYSSTFNFAAGATAGEDFATGFIYRKLDGYLKENRHKSPDYRKETNPTMYGVLAYKSYFLFGKTFLALGAGITNEKPEFEGTIRTTLDQSPSINGREEKDWQLNNGFAFRVLPQYTTGKTTVERQKRRTNWQKLSDNGNKNAKNYDIEVFQMTIDHGKNVKDGTYAYVVQCDGDTSAALPQVLSNTTHLQAAQSADGSSIGAIFFDAAAVLKTTLGDFKVSAPCALLAERSPGEVRLTVSDALMDAKLTRMTVHTPWGVQQIAMPVGKLCGQPASIVIPLKKP